MNIDLDVESSRPAPDRDEGCDRDVHRSGHRREYDARQPRRSISDRVDGVVLDVGMFRAVALSDMVKRHFDGHTFAAGAALGEAQRQGWIVRGESRGSEGWHVHRDRGDTGRRGAGGGAVGAGRPA